ncbi:hypothetical protein GRH90_07505 [Enterobacteriales bacterium SAP-6]|uniref:Uncharacterized protein n=2 Tax=Acerihabitans arboris TaxID=2691583 RepID=A0A845SIX9_9GAMM|nr:hypothetical protein [Acerihabitans arboris]
MTIPAEALRQTHDTVSLLIGQASLALHRRGARIHPGAIVTYLAAEQEREHDEIRRFFIGVAIGLLRV